VRKDQNEAQQRQKGSHNNEACHAIVVEGKSLVFNTIPTRETLWMELLRAQCVNKYHIFQRYRNTKRRNWVLVFDATPTPRVVQEYDSERVRKPVEFH
jgi:hypothetical protein